MLKKVDTDLNKVYNILNIGNPLPKHRRSK
jgi:hypothetical protein